MEDKYVLLVANGDIVKTENGKDIKKGNALYQNLMDFMEQEMKEDGKNTNKTTIS